MDSKQGEWVIYDLWSPEAKAFINIDGSEYLLLKSDAITKNERISFSMSPVSYYQS